MKRSDFLAIIPALSAIPLLGKNIVKTDGGIFIEKPKPIEIVNDMSSIRDNWMDLECVIVHRETQKTVAQAYITNFTMTAAMNGPSEITLEATVNGAFIL